MQISREALGFCLVLFVITILYMPILPTDFFSIDDSQLTQVELIQNTPSLEGVVKIFTPGVGLDYYPLRDLTYWIDAHVFDNTPFNYRLQQLFWFFVLCWALWRIQLNFGVSQPLALGITFVWALHPYHTEMLSWISIRKDLLALTFGALGFLAYQKNKFWLCVALFGLSLGSKASLVLMPLLGFVALLLGGLEPNRKNFLQVSILSLLGVGSALFQKYFYSHHNDMSIDWGWDMRIKGVLIALGKYFVGFFDSSQIVLDVEFWGDWFTLNSKFLSIGVLLMIGFVVFLFRAQKNFKLMIWSAAIVLAYLPISALIFPHRIFYASRYIEAVLFVFVLGLGIFVPKTTPRILLGSVGIFFALFFGYGTFKRVHLWAEPIELWEAAVKEYPQSIPLRSQFLTELENQKNARLGMAAEWAELNKKSQHLMGELEKDCPLEGKAKFEENCVGVFHLRMNIEFRKKDSKQTRFFLERSQVAILNSPWPLQNTYLSLNEKLKFYAHLFGWDKTEEIFNSEKLKKYPEVFEIFDCLYGQSKEGKRVSDKAKVWMNQLTKSGFYDPKWAKKISNCQ